MIMIKRPAKQRAAVATLLAITAAQLFLSHAAGQQAGGQSPSIRFLPVPGGAYERIEAFGHIDAAPGAVWRVLTDFGTIYSKNVVAQKILKRNRNSTWLYVHCRITTLDFSYVLKITRARSLRHLVWEQDEGGDIGALLKSHGLTTTGDFSVNRGDWLLAPSNRGGTDITYTPCLALSNPLFNLVRGHVLSQSIPGLFEDIRRHARTVAAKDSGDMSIRAEPVKH